MAGWSSFNHSSCSYIDVKVEYIDECEERVERLFDQALLVFLEEEGNKRPLPAVIGDGEKVDLFKLFVLVREREGFDSVSRKGLWELVAKKLGFDCSVSPSLKLIYSKYLDRMEKWAVEKKTRNVSWDSQGSVKKGCYGGLLHELGNGFKGLLGNGKCEKRNRDMVFGCEESGSGVVNRKRLRESGDEVVEVSCVPLSVETVVCVEEEGLDLSSKKQRDLPGMLKWLTAVAISPDDPSIGVIPHFSKWKKYTGNQCWIQATRAKNALLVKRDNVDQCRYQTSPLLMAHQTLHPSMYDDERERKSIGRLRYGIRPPHSSKHHSSLGCDGCSVSLNKLRSNNCRELAIIPARTDLIAGTSGTTDLQVYSNAITHPKKLDIPIRHVPIGPRYQAQVDEWTGSGIDSDTKWLGTRLWPKGNEEALDNTLGNDLIGKGRPDSCSCDILRPGSVECIRFHIAEKRMELKRELGDVFLRWRFNQMGEEVCLRWTDREEKRFKDIMISDPRSFWQNAARCFGGKKREQLVSYYFNVFLINKRRYQNRVTPRHIDSDGDDEPFGCVGNSFGRDAVTTVGSETMICAQNRQCFDFE